MGIDKTSVPEYVNIWFDDSPAFLAELRKVYKTQGCDEKDPKKMVMSSMEGLILEPEELYLDEQEGKPVIYSNFRMVSANGAVDMSVSLPLSDVLFIDIVQYAIKRLNKLKVASEALK